MEKYKNKYRIKSHRLPGWDYSGNGMYFLTFVTQERVCSLGKIVETQRPHVVRWRLRRQTDYCYR